MASVLNRSGSQKSRLSRAVFEALEGRQLLSVSTPHLGTPFTTGQTVLAVNYDNGGESVAYHDTSAVNQGLDKLRPGDGVDIQAGGSTGNVVAYAIAGEWLDYTINVPAAGNYTLQASVANTATGGLFHAEFEGTNLTGTNLTGAVAVPKTGSWYTYSTVTSKTFALPAGQTVMRLLLDHNATSGGVANFDTLKLVATATGLDLPFTSPVPVGQTIEAENFDIGGESFAYHDTTPANLPSNLYRPGDGVDIQAGGSNGFNVGSTAAGEWLNYWIDVPTAGTYQFQASLSNTASGGTLHGEVVAGHNITGELAVPNTGSFSTFSTVTSGSFTLPAGKQILHVVLDSNSTNGAVGNIDWFKIVPASTGGPAQPLVWSTKANAPIGVFEAHGTAADGKLYVFGGFDADTPNFASTNAAEAYDPATNTWATLAPMPVAESHSAVATDGTYIYVAGGYIYNPKTGWQTFGTTDVLRYDIAHNTWSFSVPLPQPRGGGELDYLNGQLHYFDGLDGVDNPQHNKIPVGDHWMLNLNSPNPQWVTAASVPLVRNHLASVVLDGKIYALGGRWSGADTVDPTADCLVWDPANPNVWTPIASLPAIRAVSTAAVYNGKIYLVGGTTTGYKITASVVVYDPTTNTWTTQTSIPDGRFAPVAGVVGNTLIVTTGFSFNNNGVFETTTWTTTLT